MELQDRNVQWTKNLRPALHQTQSRLEKTCDGAALLTCLETVWSWQGAPVLLSVPQSLDESVGIAREVVVMANHRLEMKNLIPMQNSCESVLALSE